MELAAPRLADGRRNCNSLVRRRMATSREKTHTYGMARRPAVLGLTGRLRRCSSEKRQDGLADHGKHQMTTSRSTLSSVLRLAHAEAHRLAASPLQAAEQSPQLKEAVLLIWGLVRTHLPAGEKTTHDLDKLIKQVAGIK